MAYWRFLTMATLGSIVWIGGLGLLGRAVGHQWQTWKHHLDYVDYAGIAILVVVIVWGIARWVRRAREDDAAARADVARD
jgi:membrane protein DedA with SNARE-associated domain